jgi:hypothetical protein
METPYLPMIPLRFTRMFDRTSMVNVKLLLAVSALVCRAFALATNSTDNGDYTRPNFLGSFPSAIEVNEEELRAGLFDPANSDDKVYETARIGDGKPLDWT